MARPSLPCAAALAPQREAAQQFIKDTSDTGYRYGVSELKLELPRVAD